MMDIPNTEYVTINKEGIFVGGKPATRYHGYEMLALDKARKDFAKIQKIYTYVEELHIGAFQGIKPAYATPGNPTGKSGLHAWCRAKFRNGDLGDWVACFSYPSDFLCGRCLVEDCTNEMCEKEPDFRSAVLKHKNKEYSAVKVMEFGNYRFTIEKIVQNVR